MRDFLFRGKTYKGDWIEGNFIDWGNHVQVYIFPLLDFATSYDLGASIRMYAQAVIPETVGQFTGLTDKNGKKIFEGDIVELLQISSRDKKDEIHEKIILYVAYGADGYPRLYSPNEKGSIPFFYWNYRGINVIGNIHDNPELLEELQNG